MKHSTIQLFSLSTAAAIASAIAMSATAATTLYEEAAGDRDLTPRSELVFTKIPAALPAGTERLLVDVWCADETEENFSIYLHGGKGAEGKLLGEAKPFGGEVNIFPPKGSQRVLFPIGYIKSRVDANALSDITVRVIDGGAPCRFGIERVVALAKGDKAPEIVTPSLRHVTDAAEHGPDFAKFKAECAHGDFVIGMATSMENVRPRGAFSWRKADKIGVRLARGEYESVQILVAPNGKDLKGVHVALDSDLKPVESSKFEVESSKFAATNVAACVVGYTESKNPPPFPARTAKGVRRGPTGWYPDPILDFQKSCDVSGTDVQSFWVRVKCPRDQAAGVYEGALVVSAQGAKPVRLPFTVRVNDFEVGRASPLPLAISFVPHGQHGVVATNEYRQAWKKPEMEEAYCDFLADYYITWDSLYSGGWEGPKWDMLLRLKEQGRLGLFNLGFWYWSKSEARFRGGKGLPKFREHYEKAKELGLLDHAYLYGCDEEPLRYGTNIAISVKVLKEEFPEVPVMTTAQDKGLGVDDSPLGQVDIFVPATCWWNPPQVERARRGGRHVWWYFCNDPAYPWANAALEGPPCELRSLMGAQTQKFKPEGFLYWTISRWMAEAPIKSGPFTDWPAASMNQFHGDGQWTCCGGPNDMVLPTLRLENFRDGLEDLWYARTLEAIYAARRRAEMRPEEKILKQGGEVAESDWNRRAREALAVPEEIVKSVRDFSVDPEVIYRWRNEMADLIEEAGKQE